MCLVVFQHYCQLEQNNMLFIQYTSFLVLVAVAYGVEGAAFRDGYQYHEASKAWFKLYKGNAGWHDARKKCNLEGATLASPTDKHFVLAIETIANETKTYSSSLVPVYVGVHSTFSSEVWHSIEGIPLSKIADFVKIINLNGSEKQCAVYVSGIITSVSCTDQHPYICYKRESDARLISCRTTDTAYKFYQRTGSCYKYHNTSVSWLKAYETCYTERAYLLILNSQTEAKILQDIYKETKKSSHTGIVDWEKNGEWYTIDGKRLEDSGFPRWSSGFPKGVLNGLYCLHVDIVNNLLFNINCQTYVASFVCEKHSRILDNINGTYTEFFETNQY